MFAQAAPLVRFPAGSGPVRIEKRVYQWERADAREDGGQAGGRITATCARRGDAGDELDLADWAHLDRPVGAIHRAAFLEDGGDEFVAGVEVGEQFRQQIGPAAAVPQMMAGIDDWQLRFENRLLLLFCEPTIVGLAAMTKPARLNR